MIDQQIQYKEQELSAKCRPNLRLDAKINTIPNVKVALEGINTQYQSAKPTYDELLKKRNDARLQVDRAKQRAGRNNSRA